MKSISTEHMRRLDQIAIERYGIPSLILMENAGRGIADLASKMLRRGQKVLVVCGKGNNGGDGFAAARHLANRGYRVAVVVLDDPKDLKDDPSVNYKILKKMGVDICRLILRAQLTLFERLVRQSRLIVDGIFGVGLERPVTGLFYEIIDLLNRSGKPILAIDIPSGLNSDSGKLMGIAVCAAATGTLHAAKRGLFAGEGPAYAGKITVLDISIPRKLLI